MIAVLSLFFVFGIKVTAAQSSAVQTCPKTKAAWDHRSSMFTCLNNTKYHCVMDSTWTLVEICITSLNISRNIGGCPMVYIFDSKGFWLFPFTPCPIENNECPQESHGDYTSEQLFKYPACFLNKDEREINGTGFQQSTVGPRVSTTNAHREEFNRQDVAYIPYAFGTTLILIVFIFVLFFVQKRHTQNLFKKAMTQEPSRGYSEISFLSPKNSKDIKENDYANFAVPDLGTKKRSNNSFEADIKEDEYTHLPDPEYGTYTRSRNSYAVLGSTSPQKNCKIKENEFTHPPVHDYRTEKRSHNSFEAGGYTRQNNCVPYYGTETRSHNSFEAGGYTSRQKNYVPYYGTETRSHNSFEAGGYTSRQNNCDLRERELTIFSITDNQSDSRSTSSQNDGSLKIRHDLGGREHNIFSIPCIENKSQSSSSSKDDGSENVIIKQEWNPLLCTLTAKTGNTIPRKNYTVT